MKTKGSTPHSLKPGGSGVPARRGRPPKNKKKLLKRAESSGEPAAAAAAGEPSRGLIQAEQRCDYCQQSPLCNRKGLYEALLFCKDCTAKAHPSCMDYSEELSSRARKGAWQCIDCKTCCICLDAGDPDLMLFCDGCDKGYHTSCHLPQVTEKPSGKWVCGECTSDGVVAEELERKERERQLEREREKELEDQQFSDPPHLLPVAPANIKQEAGSSLPLTPAASPSTDDAGGRPHFDPGAGRKLLSKEPRFTTTSTYPDATDWTIDDVASFLTSAGFSEQAEVFRDQEIDGKSLLLMKRSDVLTGLSLKLGPALKIHRHVQRLQLAGMCDSSSRM
ncbi:uncharacterized protein LOC143279807 isoform X2 [Babylonia areolata]|uniref:uncharacterized protein LOC143279807 isoform X2 n=1 Tax=Babylonia areolata TaxID=304850 RepID=UPI003FD25F94